MSRSRNRKQARRDFAEAVLRVSRAAAAEAVADGSARLEEGQVFTYRHTQLVGTFLTAEVPWVFTRQGVEPEGAVQHKTYEPYRRPSGAAGA